MNSQRLLYGTIVLALACSVAPLGANDDLADVKRLYVAAQYEEALTALSRGTPSASSEADEYRVLCLLGLGRAADAELVVERLVLRNPLATPDLDGRSPKFSATYLKVHKRILTVVAPTMYGLARASFDAKNFPVASAQFKELLVLLGRSEGHVESINDLRMLADGFAILSHRQQAEAAAPVAPRPAAAASERRAAPAAQAPVEAEIPAAGEIPVEETLIAMVLPPEAPSAAVDGGKPFAPWRPQPPEVFGSEDIDVRPPVAVDQQMPSWIAPPAYANSTFRGTLEILVAENGLVTSVKSLERTHPLYDTMLLAAAKRWRYEPAVKDGKPVQYRKLLEFTLRAAR